MSGTPTPTVSGAAADWRASLENDPRMRDELEQQMIALLGPAADIQSVSPEMLLALLQNRARDLDGQINSIMLGMNDRTQRAEQIGERLSEMRNVQTFLQPYTNSDGNVRRDDRLDQGQFYSLCRAAGLSEDEARTAWTALTAESSATTVELDTAIDHLFPTSDGGEPMSSRLSTRQGMDNEIDNLNQDLQDCNRGNELLMIKLQTLMDQRKQSFETTSNLLKIGGDTLERITGNIT
jgi:hypothetical protein